MGRVLLCALVAGCGFSVHVDVVAIDARVRDAPDAAADLGLIAWYQMDVFATTIDDASGNGHAGTCTSCPTVAPGKIGAAYDFSFDRIDVAETPLLVTASAFTVAFWVQFDTLPGNNYACPISKGQASNFFNTWQLCYQASTQAWFFATYNNATFDTLTSTPGPTLDQWHHAAIRWDGATKQIWIDGVMRTSSTHANLAFDGKPVTLGADIDNGNTANALDGLLDDVRIYNRALAPAEIASLAQQ